MASTSLSVTSLVKKTLARNKATVRDVVAIVSVGRTAIARQDEDRPLAETLPVADPEAPVRITKDEATALRRLAKLGTEAPDLPTEARTLTEDELKGLGAVWDAAKTAKGIVERIERSSKPAILAHHTLTVDAEAEKAAEEGKEFDPVERTKDGHAAVNRKYSIPGVSAKISIETSKGAMTLGAQDLREIVRDEAIKAQRDPEYVPVFTKEDLVETTEWVLVRKDDALLEKISARPELGELIADRAEVAPSSVSIYRR